MRMKRNVLMAALIVMIFVAAIGGTVAYLTTSTAPVINTFEPQQVTCDIEEAFDGTTKTSITVKNTCEIPVYIRVALIPYYTDGNGVAGKPSWTPEFTLNTDWFKGSDGYYYYSKAVAPDTNTPSLTNSIVLPEGGALKIAAEAIQAEGGAVTVADPTGWTIKDLAEQ